MNPIKCFAREKLVEQWRQWSEANQSPERRSCDEVEICKVE
jgi:hypothetical protein